MTWLSNITIDQFARYLLIVFCSIGLTVSLISIITKKHKYYMFLIPVFFSLILGQLLINEFSLYLGYKTRGKSNITNLSLAIYLSLEEATLLILMTLSSGLSFLKNYSKFAITALLIANLICWIYIDLWPTYLSIISTIEAFLMIFSCLYYYYEILKNPPILILKNEPSFWIVSGVFFLFICITPINLAIKSTFVVNYLKSVDSIAYMLIISLFTKATTCKPKIKTLLF